jgi:hypothetical protein
VILRDWMPTPLSLGERVRVRGNSAFSIGQRRRVLGTIQLRQSSG